MKTVYNQNITNVNNLSQPKINTLEFFIHSLRVTDKETYHINT